ncbi:MAG: diaminopimelate epimerase, partial [Acidobacteriaceae bacterium]|nr:diaminopimelate epimerase [Acidobacteriaceae bacterium]
MNVPFLKAHGAGNDFLLTWSEDAPPDDHGAVARAICDRHTGFGADGWLLVKPDAILLFNADGSEAELSGNGTRCAAAML